LVIDQRYVHCLVLVFQLAVYILVLNNLRNRTKTNGIWDIPFDDQSKGLQDILVDLKRSLGAARAKIFWWGEQHLVLVAPALRHHVVHLLDKVCHQVGV